MNAPAVVVLLVGVGVIAVSAYRLASLRDDGRASQRRLARAARREAVRQEQDRHPVDRLDWTPYRRPRLAAPSRALWHPREEERC